MAERNAVKPRTCQYCRQVQETTAQRLKDHAQACNVIEAYTHLNPKG